MKPKTLWGSLIICCILAAIIVAFTNYSKKQRELYQAKLTYVRNVQEKEKEWIRQNQGDQGQIYLNYTDNGAGDVNPYFACTAAQGLLTGDVSAEDMGRVEKYLSWHRERYLAEEGKISNYRQTEGVLLSEGEKDSVDSYTAVFLSLLCKYGEKGGAVELTDPGGEALLLGLHTLETLWNNGLTAVSQENYVRYLMDNIEVQAALTDVRDYLKKSGGGWIAEDMKQDCIDRIETMIAENRNSIEELLWNTEAERYEIGLGDSDRVLKFEDWKVLYPDAAVQIYGAAFSQDAAESKRTKKLYEMFCSVHEWETMDLTDDEKFGWAVFSFAAAAIGDEKRAETYLKTYENKIVSGRKYPLHTAEAGWISKTCEELERRYIRAIDRNIFEVMYNWVKEQAA